MMGENDLATGYMMGQNENRNNGWGFGGDWLVILVLFALLGGGWGFGGGFGGFGGGGYGLQGMATRADINEGFALQNITSGIQGIHQ